MRRRAATAHAGTGQAATGAATGHAAAAVVSEPAVESLPTAADIDADLAD